jgi:hypothetical protein
MEKRDTFSFKVAQALHGYRDGHRLLTSSIQLDEFATIEMARMSDLMPKRLKADGYYFCAYPLKSINRYVLSCTWPAPEMPRPGCVWTHSLIMDYAIVAKLVSIQSLIPSFRKPEVTKFDEFVDDLWVSDSDAISYSHVAPDLFTEIDENFLKMVLHGVYYASGSKIVIPAAQFDVGRSIVPFLIWNQMPPRLRRDFVFCTAGNARSQLPNTLVSVVITEDEMPLLEPVLGFSSIGFEALLADVHLNRRSELRAFISRYVTDIGDSRLDVPKLAHIGISLLEGGARLGMQSAAIAIAEYFPDGGEAKLLKKELLWGILLDSKLYTDNERFSLLMEHVLPTFFQLPKPFDEELANGFLDRYIFLAESNATHRSLELIVNAWNTSSDSFGRQLLNVLVSRSETHSIAKLSLSAEIKLFLASLDGRLLKDEVFWQNFETAPTFEDWEALNKIGTLESLVSGFLMGKMYAPVLAMLREHSDKLLPPIVQFIVNSAPDARKELISEFRVERVRFLRYLGKSNSMELQILKELSEDIFYFPNPYIKPEEWGTIINCENAPDLINPYLAFIMFDQANTTDRATAAELYCFSFGILHSVEANTDIASRGVTKKIYQTFSRDYNNQYTDAANRIRRRFCDFFQDYRDYPSFLKCAKDEKTLILLFETMIGSWRGRDWLQGLSLADEVRAVRLDPIQRLILSKFLEKRKAGFLGIW